MRPTELHVGGTLYWTLLTRDPDTLLLKDADATPTVAVRKNGASVGDSVTVTKRSATTGIYDCSYNPAGEAEGDSYILEERARVTGTTTAQAYYDSSFQVRVVTPVAAEAVKTAAIKAKTDSLTFTTPGKVDATAELDSASQTEVLDAVTAANAKLDSIALKTALINAGRLRVLSRVAGNVITAHAGDDHLILAENALTLEVDDDDASLYALLTAGTNQNVKFGAGRASDTDADEISATIPAANVRHVGTSTFVDIELPSAATAGRRGEYEFDIQITNAAGYKITPQQLQGTLIVEVDRRS